MENCLFCKILAGEIPSQCVYDADGVYAFRDINPQAPTHILVIPRAHIPSCAAVTAENADAVARCFVAIARIAEAQGIAQSGYRVVSNSGADAGQTVAHLHFHILGGKKMQERMI